ncbi:MAG: hypothetical protein LBQ66_03875 [Planctomycetaceae bacterium]|nr:hypothetical protein [Planctomycetaceae bacterium]
MRRRPKIIADLKHTPHKSTKTLSIFRMSAKTEKNTPIHITPTNQNIRSTIL